MTLTRGTAPFGPQRAGEGNYSIESPAHILYFDPSPKRVRVSLGGEVVADSTRTRLLHETGLLPTYYFPIEDIRSELLQRSERTSTCPFKGEASYWSVVVGEAEATDALWAYEDPIDSAPFLRGHAAFYFDRMDAWFEEDEQIFVHPRDPYARIEVLPGSRPLRVSVEGQILAETDSPMILLETSLPPRYYVPKRDVRMDLLEMSGTATECPYKGKPVHYSAPSLGPAGEDIAWCYDFPNHDAERVKGLVAFYNEKVDLELDGAKLERPS
jgi:uncharacterized protein (DUF427 family)